MEQKQILNEKQGWQLLKYHVRGCPLTSTQKRINILILLHTYKQAHVGSIISSYDKE